MSLRHAILGFLSVEPMSGYDLKRAFDTSVRHFWSADKAAIYRTLAQLEAEGLTTRTRHPQDRRPDRHVHTLTDAGGAALDAWLRAPLADAQVREPFLLQLFFVDRAGPDARRAVIRAEREQVAARIEALEAVAAALPDAPALAGPIATLDAGLWSLRAWAAWLDRAEAWADAPADTWMAAVKKKPGIV